MEGTKLCKHYFHIKLLKHTCWANIWSNLTFQGHFKLKSVFLGRYFLLTLSYWGTTPFTPNLFSSNFEVWRVFLEISLSLSLTRHVIYNGEPLTFWNICEGHFIQFWRLVKVWRVFLKLCLTANSCEPDFWKLIFINRKLVNRIQAWQLIMYSGKFPKDLIEAGFHF